MAKNETAPAVQEKEKGLVTYQSGGQEVKLSFQIVRDYLTKGNGKVTDQDLVQFISICRFNSLNPFLNEAYLVKFGTLPAQMIVSKEALMKRAEACPEYQGIQAGVIVLRNEDELELEGHYYRKTDELVGGWAKVYRSDRKFPFVSRVRLDEYDKKQSTWNEKKSTMIAKVAKVQALREAFPSQLGSMYTQEEQAIEDAEYSVVNRVKEEIAKNANSQTMEMPVESIDIPKPTTSEAFELNESQTEMFPDSSEPKF